MEFYFDNLTFEILNGQIFLIRVGNFNTVTHRSFAEVQIAGENKISHHGVKMVYSSEGEKLKYISHEEKDGRLTIVQESELVRVTTLFTSYGDCNAVRVKTVVENISDKPFVLEEVSAFVLHGIGSVMTPDKIDLTRFTQSHHAECQPIKQSFADLGFFPDSPQNQKKISYLNVGSWSTKEALPQGIYGGRRHSDIISS